MSKIVADWMHRAKRNAGPGLKHGFRSGLEEKIGKQIEAAGLPVNFESFRIPYVFPQETRHYTPDFKLPNGIIIEGKGIFDATDRSKHLLLKVQYPDLDIRFVFYRSKASIGGTSKTTLAMWADKFGYKHAEKLIPAAWLTEPGPERDPLDVIKDGPYGYVLTTKATKK